MKRLVLAAVLSAAAGSAMAQDVGVSIHISQPGFYGEITIGSGLTPVLLYPQPVIVTPVPVGVAPPAPIYLRVPPGHQKNWARYCHDYRACGRPVYFVQEQWYHNVYLPHFYNQQGGYRGHENNRRGPEHGGPGYNNPGHNGSPGRSGAAPGHNGGPGHSGGPGPGQGRPGDDQH